MIIRFRSFLISILLSNFADFFLCLIHSVVFSVQSILFFFKTFSMYLSSIGICLFLTCSKVFIFLLEIYLKIGGFISLCACITLYVKVSSVSV